MERFIYARAAFRLQGQQYFFPFSTSGIAGIRFRFSVENLYSDFFDIPGSIDWNATRPVYEKMRTNGPLKIAGVLLIRRICILIQLFKTVDEYDDAEQLSWKVESGFV
ncbi:MAG TPA: hypothetical protein VFP87_05775 [Chitinophagaceae bacterium]|nr:hypothetical protein [Chitinophagaceae bacterium]